MPDGFGVLNIPADVSNTQKLTCSWTTLVKTQFHMISLSFRIQRLQESAVPPHTMKPIKDNISQLEQMAPPGTHNN